MRVSTATITANTEIRPGLHLIALHAPQLAQAIQPGQYCMLRCCDLLATDPLLRRPFFIQSVQRQQGDCALLVHRRGRGTTWLTKQGEGAVLDLLAPFGHGWVIPPTTRNLLLVNEGTNIAALTLLAQHAVEQELSVTLVSYILQPEDAYPPALLPPEVEYHNIAPRTPAVIGVGGALVDDHTLDPYLTWADAVYLSVSHETSVMLYNSYEPLRRKNFAQCTVIQPLVCASGVCLACSIETYSGPRLLCRDGPVFALREVAR